MSDSTPPRRRHVELGNLCHNRGPCVLATHEPRHCLPIPARTTPRDTGYVAKHRRPTMPERSPFGYATTELRPVTR